MMTLIAVVKCYDCIMLKTCKNNLVYLFKYSDTHLYEFGLCVLLVILNPFHLFQLKACHNLEPISIIILILGSFIVGLCFGAGVLLNKLEIRFFMARVYWAYTIYTLLTLFPCGLIHEIGLTVSFILQFFSSLFLLWRLGTERLYRLDRAREELQ